MAHDVASARTLLFVPGNRAERFDKALTSGADAIIVDLEDSVPEADKPAARAAIEAVWPRLIGAPVSVVVRINAPGTTAGQADVDWLARLPAPAAVMVPKAESIEKLEQVHAQLNGTPTLPLIETAAGLAALPALASARGVLRLAVGHIDFVADMALQCDDDETQLSPLRFAVALATRMHLRAPAIDGVTADLQDSARLQRDTLRALGFGFAGKLCIHPAQVPVIHAALAPTDEHVAWAKEVVKAYDASAGAAVQVRGHMVDLPVVLQARRILARANKAT